MIRFVHRLWTSRPDREPPDEAGGLAAVFGITEHYY